MNKSLSLRQGSSVRRIVGVSVFLLLLWFWPATLGSAQAKTIYVNGSVQGGDGSSWANAFTKLQDARAAALAGDEIWVAKGVYYPDEAGVQDSNDRTATFSLKNGVALYGGFAGGETSQSTRKWETNVTVLSGDIDKNDTNPDNNNIAETWNDLVGANAYHVVTGSGVTASAVLDGFTITAGRSDGAILLHDRGSGMYNDNGSPTLTNLNFRGNHALDSGGGMKNANGSNPVLTNVTFSGNRTDQNSGGGMSNFNSNPVLTNVIFRGNQAAGGGGMENTGSSPTLTNVLFTGNKVTTRGGGMFNSNSSSPVLINVTFSGNHANIEGGGLRNTGASHPQLVNTIVWGNDAPANPQIANSSSTPVISYSLVEGQNPAGTGNLDGTNVANNPQFVTPEVANNAPTSAGDYHLKATSPALDVGNNAANTTATALDGDPRLQGKAIDLGAYERLTCPAGGVLYVQQGGAGTRSGRDWENAFAALQNALQVPAPCEIWVAKGIYYPDEGKGQKADTSGSAFRLRSGIALYGGFTSGASNRTERNWQTNVTVLSGDLEQNDTGKDTNGVVTSDPNTNLKGINAGNVVSAQFTKGIVILDGFTITAGKRMRATSGGGGMFIAASAPTLADLIFSGNLTTGFGGGLHTTAVSHPTLNQVTFSGNQAQWGGGLAIMGENSTVTLTDVAFTDNSTVDFSDSKITRGGGLYVSGRADLFNKVTLVNVSFTNNRAHYGAGLYNDAELTVTGGGFTGNQAEADGGGVYQEGGTLVLTGVQINNNQASKDGGGLYSATSVDLVNTKIQGNRALNGNGGGLYSSGVIELTGVEINNNQATKGKGGGLYVEGGATSLTNVTVAGNQAASSGGIYNSSDQTLLNVVVVGNLADTGQGGGIFNQGEQTLINVTVAGNRAAEGGGILNSANLTLKNTIVWGNAPADAQLANRGDGTATISHSVLEGQNPPGVGNLDGTNVANNPTFVAAQVPDSAPTAAGDYRRQPVSPATDVGNDAVNDTTTDRAGQPRKQGTAIDLGAYENARVVVNPTGLGVGEPSGAATFLVTLTSAPTADVNITLTSSDPGECSAPGSVQLTPANGQTGVAVTVSAVDDTVADGPQPCTIQTSATSSDDPAYKDVPVADVAVTVGDNEIAQALPNPTSFTLAEANGTRDFVISLSVQPVAPVTIGLASAAPGACTVTPATVTLDATNWQTGATATVKAGPDDLATGPRTCTVMTGLTSSPNTPYHALVVKDVIVTVIDDDVVGMTGNPTPVEVSEPDGTARFILNLKTQPAADVVFTLKSSNPAVCTVLTPVTLTSATWQQGEEVTVSAVDDRFEEGDQPCSVTARAASTDINYEGQQASIAVTVHDDDRVQVVAEPTGLGVQEPNSTASFIVKLTKAPIATVKVSLTSNALDECSVPSDVTLDATNWQAGLPVTVSAVDDAALDGPQTCLITSAATSADPAYNGRQGNEVEVTVADNEKPDLDVSPDQLTISTPNGSASFTVKLTIPPVTPVGLALSSDNPACSVLGNVTPTTNNWQTGEAIAVTAAAAGPQQCIIRLTTSSTTASYNNLSREVRVEILDPNETLTVNKSSNGSGTVTSSPAGIDCGATCLAFPRNSPVTLTATPDAGSTFGNWSGDCGGSSPTCPLTLDSDKSVTAPFHKNKPLSQPTLTINIVGKGTVKNESPRINVSTEFYQRSFDPNTELTLTAEAADGYTFGGWSEDCTVVGTTCQVKLDSAKSVKATFTLIPPTKQTLEVETRAGTGSGAVTSNPAGINCGADCSEPFDHDSTVTLTAIAETPGSDFIGWGGDCTGTAVTCQVKMDKPKKVTANFNVVGTPTQRLNVTITGSGTVKSEPEGIECDKSCSFDFPQDKPVKLTATAAPGFTFARWDGGGCSGIGPCQVTMDSAKNVVATFNPVTPTVEERKVYLPVVRR